MPGLNPLMNTQPKKRIPGEAPQFFNTFFEQPVKPAPVNVWQPSEEVEQSVRSKAPTSRVRTAPEIPSIGTWPRRKADVAQDGARKGLFQPTPKNSVDEMMWLGAVTGFELKEEPSIRSKLVRKPEEIASQASDMTGPRAMEQMKKKEQAEKARQERLQAWSKKKTPAPSENTSSDNSLPIPIQSKLRPKNIYIPVAQPEDAANRPPAIHRPFMPTQDVSFTPTNTFLPQPIESTRRSHRLGVPKDTLSAEPLDGGLWMRVPEPIETIRRSTRRPPPTTEASDETKKVAKPTTSIVPVPIETSRRSNRKPIATPLPKPIETIRRSNQQTEPKQEKKELLPEPIETPRRANRKPAEETEKPEEFASKSQSESSDENKARDPAPAQDNDKIEPPTPTTAFFGPDNLSQPIETRRRSHRPLARPLVPHLVETSMRSTRSRLQASKLNVELPQPISLPRWSSRTPRDKATQESSNQPMSPGLYAPPLRRHRSNSRNKAKDAQPPADHVWHLHEPIDSAPASPATSPDGSPSVSKCPSLSSSPTSSASSLAWGAPQRVYKTVGDRGGQKKIPGGTDTRLKERSNEEPEYPFLVTEETTGQKNDDAGKGTGLERSESSATVRTATRMNGSAPNNIELEPRLALAPDQGPATDEVDDYPICASPVFAHFTVDRRPQLDHDDDDAPRQPRQILNSDHDDDNKDVPAYALDSMPSRTAGPTLSSLLPRMWKKTTAGPSPGYTVASLPPKKRKGNPSKEITPAFVEDVHRYLSMQFDSVAVKYDDEIARFTGMDVQDVRKDRKAALTKYCEQFVVDNPDILAGEASKIGFW